MNADEKTWVQYSARIAAWSMKHPIAWWTTFVKELYK